jgi:thiamine-phosphate pyrophosphorylase
LIDFNNIHKHLSLYLVTDRTWCHNTTLEDQVLQAINGGITCLQVREKDVSNQQFVDISIPLQQLANKFKIPFIINDNIEVFKALNADGIHFGQNDLNAIRTRKIIGPNKIMGVSVENVEQALSAQDNGADYLGVGAIFSTNTKFDAANLNPQALKKICEAVNIPVVAIGGINENNIKQLSGTSIKGVALVSAILNTENIEKTTKHFKKTITSLLK